MGRPARSARYTQLLAAARRGVKRSDAGALVVSAGLAPHTGNAPGTVEDVDFLRAMYAAGARGAFDVLGIHPYGGNTAPESDPASCGICFRRAEQYRRVMEENGDAATSAWVTEFGYLHTTGLDLGQYNWLKLAPEQQASHLTAAFATATTSGLADRHGGVQHGLRYGPMESPSSARTVRPAQRGSQSAARLRCDA